MWTRLVTLVSRLRVLRARRRLDDETQAEVDAHLRLLVDRYIRSGMTDAQAQAAASRQFGSVTLIREEVHQLNGLRWLDALAQDLRYAARSLRRTPAFTIAAVMTLALGIGANSAIFALADTALIRPLPFADPDRLVVVWERQASSGRGSSVCGSPSGPTPETSCVSS